MNLNNLLIGRRLTLAFAAVIAIFLMVGAAALYTAANLEKADKWNTHTYKVLREADEMILSMVNMQTGMRGYLLAGEDRFLEPWNDGLKTFANHWDEARKLTSDNPSQQKLLDDMKARHLEFKGAAESLISFRKSVNAGSKTIAELAKEFQLGLGKKAMDGFRDGYAAFDKAERDLLVVRYTEADK